jgi:Flp pilus assembly protein TadG
MEKREPSRMAKIIGTARKPKLKLALLRRFAHDVSGTTAIEAAFVLPPFFAFIFTLMVCSMYFFISSSIEKGMEAASRLIRTGQAVTQNMTVSQFQQAVCDASDGWIKCNNLQVWPQSWSDWSTIGAANSSGDTQFNADGLHNCVDQNNAVIVNSRGPNDPISTYTGTASDVVVVTTCYVWDFASVIPHFSFGNMQNGTMMIQNSTAFRSEPYPDNSGG